MRPKIVVDTNIIVRFLLDDDPKFSPQAKQLFSVAKSQNLPIFVDEVIVAEVVWILTSLYKMEKSIIVSLLQKLLLHTWVVNPRKNLILKTLSVYATHNLDYIDCWIATVAQSKKLTLTTFDHSLDNLAKSLL